MGAVASTLSLVGALVRAVVDAAALAGPLPRRLVRMQLPTQALRRRRRVLLLRRQPLWTDEDAKLGRFSLR